MSWAAHNPELWDMICVRGAQAMLDKRVPASRFHPVDRDDEAYELENMRDNPALYRVWEFLLSQATRQIVEEEVDYWSGLVDDAKERGK